MPNLLVEYLAVSDLKPNPRNARLHSKKQLHQIAASIGEFGFNVPVLIDRGNIIIAGHGRLEAARMLGMETVPVLRIEHLTDAQKRAFALADNKIALNSDWDLEILQGDMKELSALDLNFDLEITGFETAEIDLLIDGAAAPTKADRSDIIPEKQAEAVSRARRPLAAR
jgi:ParB-like chromosome segregation protein Spo0J